MRIQVLGCSGGVGPGLRTTSLLLDEHTLIDAGTGVGDLTLDQMRRIRRVFLTHSHLDHVCGLAFLADNLFEQLDQPIEVCGSAATLEALRAHLFNWTLWPDFSALPTPETPVIRFSELSLGMARDLGQGLSLLPFEVLHTVPALGYALQSAGGGMFVFTGDTTSCPALWHALNTLPRIDYLMIDIAFPDEQAALGLIARHFTPGLAARELRQLRHRPQLLLTHQKPGCEAQLAQQCAQVLGDWPHRSLQRGDVIEI
ncbi:MAG: 3',5'-cyclic-nucleotide phosphodiesterase [Panacagrimonas sp.]